MADVSSEPRAKRARVDKGGRFAALERLKKLKGSKHKYEVEEEVDNVYEVVDEREYAKKAQERYGGDWIEDDGTGYAEDGRDFFEDEDDYSDEDSQPGNSSQNNKKGTKKRPRDSEKPTKGKGSIRNLFKNAVPKKAPIAKLEDDDILADILGELKDSSPAINTPTNSRKVIAPAKITSVTSKKSEVVAAKEYMDSFKSYLKDKKQTKEVIQKETTDERVLKPKLTETNKMVETATKVTKVVEESVKKAPETVTEEPLKDSVSEDLLAIAMDDDMDFTCIKEAQSQSEIEKSKDKVKTGESLVPPEGVRAKQPSPDNKNKTMAKSKAAQADEIQNFLSNWEDICQMDDFEEEMESVATAAGTAKKNSGENLRFWYWEAWENPKKLPGEVFLFGRTSEGESLAVRVKEIERVLYLLPREYLLDPITMEQTKQKVTLADIHKEFDEVISVDLKLQSFRTRKVTKNFAFHSIGIDVPQVCDYMEVRYDGKKSAPNLKKKYRSIAHIFGANTTALERFILDRKLKGPCWLNLKEFLQSPSPMSWCKSEVIVDDPRNVVLIEDSKQKTKTPPPMSLLTLNVRTAVNPRTMKNEICLISMLVHNRFHIDKPAPQPIFNRHMCGFTKPQARTWPFDLKKEMDDLKNMRTYKHDSERSLLSWFLAQYQQVDADLIVTFDKDDCQLNIIIERIISLNIPQWSRLGRLRLSEYGNKMVMDTFLGRMICDVRKSAMDFTRSRSFDLQTLCQNVLKLGENDRVDLNTEDIEEMYETGKGIKNLIQLTMHDSAYILRMMHELNVMPLAMQITNICGNTMNRTLQRGKSEHIEFLLLHAFTEKNYIVPDKLIREWGHDQTEMGNDATTSGRKKAAYAGGLVLDPIKGLYDSYIILMDFNSLYPTIIQEYNICFTTVQPPYSPEEMPTLPPAGTEFGILPQQVRRLVDSRREVKKLMASSDITPEQKMQYHIRQMALKLTANSMYGCLGASISRFHAQHLAALITYKGREILMNTKSLVEKMNYTVVYGDTDSIMVNTNITDYDQVFRIGNTIQQSVSKAYKLLELEMEGVFGCLLLLKKKKYAAVKLSKNSKGEFIKEQEHKGLDIVRRDWSQIAIMIGKLVLDEILSENQLDEKLDAIHAHLEKIRDSINNEEVPQTMFVITKQLSKAPTEFANKNAMSHVQVALRMNQTRNRRYKKGDMVDYVICDDGTNNPATQRAYHLDELKGNEKLKIDKIYYLAHQVHPVVTRMVEVLEGTDPSRIAECLGLDPTKFRHAAHRSIEERAIDHVGESIIKSSLQKYRLCDKFQFTCLTCKTENIVCSAFRPKGSVTNSNTTQSSEMTRAGDPVLQKCINPECVTAPYEYVMALHNQLLLNMRKYITRFYENWMVCDEPSCNLNTRFSTHVMASNRPICLNCKRGTLVRQYTERDLYNQLCYFQYMFDLSHYKGVTLLPEVVSAYQLLRETVDEQLNKSAYSTIALSQIFARFKPFEENFETNRRKIELPTVTVASSLDDE